MIPSNKKLILGPCSAESREQVLATAEGIKANFDNIIFRAGVWKPRTRPGSFEGMGVQALDWLVEVKEKFGFDVCTEVADAKHVEACLEKGIDRLWIGARTTVNPFSVQGIADALQGTDTPVMVKNPIHADFNLWMGAIERIEKAGLKQVWAIHRGFYYFDNGPYRNFPSWDLVIKLKTERPELPIICDVSHIAGTTELIPELAQKALDLNLDGLHMETHVNPAEALSDAKQQLTPAEVKEVLDKLAYKSPTSTDATFNDSLEQLRKKIDKIDYTIIQALSERMNVATQIGEQKRKEGVAIFQQHRWDEIRQKYITWGQSQGLDKSFVENILQEIHKESIEMQST